MDDRHSRIRVAELLSTKIIHQEIVAGRSVGEAALASELGVSRTPIREALLGLENDGLVGSRRGRGFVVQALNVSEARQIYPIIAALERLAVENSEPLSPALTKQLHALNEQLASAATPAERLKLDDAWHRLIVSGCSNNRLQSLIKGLKQTVQRYEYSYLKVAAHRDRSIDEHAHLVALLEQDPRLAAGEIEQHWLKGMEQVVSQLEEGAS